MKDKIFCIGLPKTGTSSLEQVLEDNGIKLHRDPWDIVLVDLFQSGKFNIFDVKHMREFDGLSEMPAAIYYKELFHHYPNAKFIYTTRKKGPWLKSCENWWKRFIIKNNQIVDIPLRREGRFNDQHGRALGFLKAALFGCYLYDENRFSHVYENHLANVFAFFAGRDNLLHLPLEISDEGKCKLLSAFLDIEIKEYKRCNVQNYKK